jgi:hypothetical protein
MDDTKTAPPDIRHRIAFFQPFFPGYFGGHAVEMDRKPRVPVGYGRSEVPYGLAAPGTIGNRQRLRGHLRRGPFGPLDDNPPAFVETGTVVPALASPEIPVLLELFIMGRCPPS